MDPLIDVRLQAGVDEQTIAPDELALLQSVLAELVGQIVQALPDD